MKHDSVLDVCDVSVRFGGLTALDAVSLTVEPRQVLGVIGPNGAGKTTLLNVLCGFIRPDEGQVLLDGRRYHDLRPHRLAGLGIARTLQGVGLFGEPVRGRERHDRRELPGLGRVLAGPARAAALEPGRAQAAAGGGRGARPGRRGRGGRQRPGELSYGMRKRVALARALAARPKLLLLDEPASGLAEDELAELGGLIRELAAETSLVIVEHHMDLMMSVCDSLVVLDFGKVISRGSPQVIQADPAVTTAYLGVSGAGDE